MAASGWLLPDDGIIDQVAVDIAAAGTRPVRLTEPERRLAAAKILAARGNSRDIAARLHMHPGPAKELADSIRMETAKI